MNKIQIMFIEDNRILCESIESMFKKQIDLHVVGIISSSENTVQMIGNLKPDIILVDLILANKNSLHLVKLIREQFKEIKIIVIGLLLAQSNISEYIENGVAGFILKDADTARFIKTISKVSRGLKVLPPLLTSSLFSQIVQKAINGSASSSINKTSRLTQRELEIMNLVADGFTNKEIAQKLNISNYTVKSHVHNILEKLAFSTRTQIAKFIHLNDSLKSSLDTTSLLEE